MILLEDEVERAARLLYEKTTERGVSWDDLGEGGRGAYREVVTGLAGMLPGKRTPEGVAVFMLWMGGGDAPLLH